ncbi:MAG: hypothetical protein GY847_18130 [Proteobacteria bacterium]|nr:hypothetical protein [Pseudomonadota bacterium]
MTTVLLKFVKGKEGLENVKIRSVKGKYSPKSFWEYFDVLTAEKATKGKTAGSKTKKIHWKDAFPIDDLIKAYDIPLWQEDLRVAIGIDPRFEEHFRRVIQLAVWVTDSKKGPACLIEDKTDKDDSNEIITIISGINADLNTHLEKFIQETIKALNRSYELSNEAPDFYGIFVHHIVRMLALYHDIGKRVSIPRHQDEGYFHLRNVISKGERERLKLLLCPVLVSEGKNRLKDVERRLESELWDVFLMVIRYHDCAGSLGTGEASLGLLVDALSYQTKSLEKQRLIVFLIYFTNILDISSSIGKTGRELSGQGGMKLEKINNLCDDLTIFERILIDAQENPADSGKNNNGKSKGRPTNKVHEINFCGHSGYTYINKRKFEEEILRLEKTEHRCVGRIARLLREGAPSELSKRLYDGVIKEAIVGAVGHTNIPEFSRRLGSVTRLDYMLAFVQWLLRYPEKIWASIMVNVSQNRVRELLNKIPFRDLGEGKVIRKKLADIYVEEICYLLRKQMLEILDMAGVEIRKSVKNKKSTLTDIGNAVMTPEKSDIKIETKTRILEKLGRFYSGKDSKEEQETEKKIAGRIDTLKRKYSSKTNLRDRSIQSKLSKIGTTLALDGFAGDVKSYVGAHYAEKFGSIIPPDRRSILKQWFSDSKLVDHYLYSDNTKSDPVFMSTHVIAILWHIIQKYPPQHKHEEPQLSRMGISVRRLTDPDQIAERIVPLIVASGKPSHAYTWIEEEVTIWHYN